VDERLGGDTRSPPRKARVNEPQVRTHGWSAVIVTAIVVVVIMSTLVVGIGRSLGLFV
jgi:hypothetical protein